MKVMCWCYNVNAVLQIKGYWIIIICILIMYICVYANVWCINYAIIIMIFFVIFSLKRKFLKKKKKKLGFFLPSFPLSYFFSSSFLPSPFFPPLSPFRPPPGITFPSMAGSWGKLDQVGGKRGKEGERRRKKGEGRKEEENK